MNHDYTRKDSIRPSGIVTSRLSVPMQSRWHMGAAARGSVSTAHEGFRRKMEEIELPWPPQATSANKSKSGNWWERSSAAKSYKAACFALCLEQGVRKQDHDGKPFPVVVTFHPPTNARMDADNAYNRVKAAQDAVSMALGIDDCFLWPAILCKGEKVKGGKIVFSFPDGPAGIMHAIYPVQGTVS